MVPTGFFRLHAAFHTANSHGVCFENLSQRLWNSILETCSSQFEYVRKFQSLLFQCICEEIGCYDPTVEPHNIQINAERAKTWIANGAQPTDTVRNLLKKQEIL